MRQKTGLGMAAAAAALLMAAGILPAHGKEFLLTGIKPDKLVLVDAKARKIERIYTIPNAAPGQTTITASPDGKVAYAVVNRWESISGIDLDTGEQVFRADLSTPEVRVKIMFGMDISPDGKELAVYESPVRLGVDAYEVLPSRISIYETSAGLNAKPVRQFEVPRQITVLAYAKDGKTIYGMGRSLYGFDSRDGKIKVEHKTQKWDRPNFYPPDILDVWHQFEQAGVFSTPYYTARSDMDLANPEAWWTGMLTLDLASGAFDLKEVANLDVFYFSTVVNPVRRNEAYGVYLTLAKLDVAAGKRLQSVDLDHAYYDVNVSGDGSELYLGGTMGDIAVYSSETLEKLGAIHLPGAANMALSNLRVIDR